EREEHERGGPRREAVHAVGDVHGVRGSEDDEDRPHGPEPRPEVEVDETGERQVRGRVDVAQPKEREACRHRQQSGCLAPLPQPEVPALPHSQVVVDEPDGGQRDDQQHQRDPGARELELLRADVRDQVAEERAHDDGEAAHRRRPRLRRVRMPERPVVANRLTDPPRPQHPDQKGSPEHAEEERDRRREQQRNHAPTAEVRASATRSSPTARLALTSTASPERARPETATTAPSASSTSITCARPRPASRAPSAIARAPEPTATTTSTSVATARRPTFWCSARAWLP